jgi:transmembrane sensor
MSSARDIEECAAALLARLDSEPADPRLQTEIREWIAADPRHEVAYLRLRATWRHLDRLQALGSYENAKAHIGKPQPPVRPTGNRRRAQTAACAGIVFTLASLWWLTTRWRQSDVLIVATPLGGYERRLLADGSTLELNTDTAVEVDFHAAVRHVRLLRGEGRFLVAQDTRRPFLVEVGSRSVRAVGTDFTVRLESASTEVFVNEGRVRLETPHVSDASGSTPGDTLDSGQLALLTTQGIHIRTLGSEEIDARLAWGKGLLVFTGDSLAKASEEFNRYNTTKLRVVDPAAAELRVAGTFRATNVEAFLRLLEQGFPVSIVRSADTVTITTRPSNSAPGAPGAI